MVFHICRSLFYLVILTFSSHVHGLHILHTSDDGVNVNELSLGAQVLRQALIDAGHTVTTVVPSSNRSGCGSGVDSADGAANFNNPFKIIQSEIISGGNNPIYKVSLRFEDNTSTNPPYGATTTTCILVGLSILKEASIVPNIVVAGMNIGGNFGPLAINSGTVNGALATTSTLYTDTVGVSGIAVSCGVPSNTAEIPIILDNCASFIVKLLGTLNALPFGSLLLDKVALNINYPPVLADQIAGVALTQQGEVFYPFPFQAGVARFKISNPGPIQNYVLDIELAHLGLTPEKEHDDGTAMNNNYISITPIDINLTARGKNFGVFSNLVKALNKS